jgi:hypothetical protein
VLWRCLARLCVFMTTSQLGGHSLLATQILSRVVATFQIDLPLSTLLVASTVAQMAMVIAQHQVAQTDPHAVTRLLADIEALAEDDVTRRLADDAL